MREGESAVREFRAANHRVCPTKVCGSAEFTDILGKNIVTLLPHGKGW